VVAQVVDYADPEAVHLHTWMPLTCLPLERVYDTAVWEALAVELVSPAHARLCWPRSVPSPFSLGRTRRCSPCAVAWAY
jgi:hypothetical protein